MIQIHEDYLVSFIFRYIVYLDVHFILMFHIRTFFVQNCSTVQIKVLFGNDNLKVPKENYFKLGMSLETKMRENPKIFT